MIGFQPNRFWRLCWAFVTPTILTVCLCPSPHTHADTRRNAQLEAPPLHHPSLRRNGSGSTDVPGMTFCSTGMQKCVNSRKRRQNGPACAFLEQTSSRMAPDWSPGQPEKL